MSPSDERRSVSISRSTAIAVLVSFLWAVPSYAIIEAELFETPQLEERYSKLIKEFRCLVCQNQNLADSDADLAQDLRKITADMLRAGNTDQEISNFMQERYGDFVLYRTPFTYYTAFIWIAPGLALALGLLLFFRRARNRPAVNDESDIKPDALERAKSLLNSSGSEDK